MEETVEFARGAPTYGSTKQSLEEQWLSLSQSLVESTQSSRSTLGMRHFQSFLIFLAMVATHVCRWNLSVAMVAMTNAKNANPKFPEYNWNEKEISYIHSSFFWGNMVTQYSGGIFCKRYGVKTILGWSTAITAVLCALTPWSVSWGGWQTFCCIRVLQGLSQGVVFPCAFEHVAKWSPTHERNRLGAFALSGLDCGTVLVMGMSGIIAKGFLGWPGIFYISAAISFLWCPLWLIFGANTPAKSKFINEIEKKLIESSLPPTNNSPKRKISTPWKAVFTSIPFMVFLVARCTQIGGVTTFAIQIPAYFSGVLNMEIKSNALFSALPFLTSWLMTYVFMLLGDILQHRKILTLTSLRRLFNSIACWIPAACLIGIGFIDEEHKTLALILMTISVGVSSGNIIGCSLNIIDLTPNHTAVLYSIVNMAGNLMPLLSPLVVGVVVTDMHNRYQWQIVFAISAAIFFFGNLVYIIFGTTETQPWDAEDYLLPKDTECSKSLTEKNKLDHD